MAEHEEKEFGHAVAVLREVLRLSQEEVARDAHISPKALSRIEQGKTEPKRKTVEGIAAGLHVPLATLERTTAFNRSVAAEREAQTALPGAGLLDPDGFVAGFSEARRTRTIVDFVAGELGLEPRRKKVAGAEAEYLQALALWQRLERRSAAERRALVEEVPEFWSWRLSVLICDKSAAAAADDADQALELTELGLEVARRVHPQDGFQARVEGRAWVYVGNARRVGGNLPGAAEAFSEYHRLWLSGSDPEGLLDEVPLLDLEASLLRDQRHFAKAHTLLDRALEARPTGPAAGRVLLIKAKTFREENAYESAVATLRQAVPLVEAARDPRLPLVLRTNLIENLLDLGHLGDAERMLAEAAALAAPLSNVLDQIRLRWLGGRIAAGTGRPEEAAAILAEVRSEFAARGIAYDTALVTLELAAVLAELGRTAEVQALAEETAEVFQAQGVPRERFAAVQLFVEAARREALTAELARLLLLDLRNRS